MNANGNEMLSAVLERRRPSRIVYAPNYWQWFAHNRNHGTLPPELAGCHNQLDVIRHLGLDVFSRNIYCDEQRGWWGGLSDVVWRDVESEKSEHFDGKDRVIERTYRTRSGALTERLRYVFGESTLVQEKFLVDDYENQIAAFEQFLLGRRWKFVPERYARWQTEVGGDGFVVAGEVHSPLKMLHVLLGPQNTTFFLMDWPERASELLALHEAAQLDLIGQMVCSGVRVVMAMDNLDTAFHPPHYVEQYSASFYEKASRLCHEHGSLFFIHACGKQRANLSLISSLGVDGLEGVSFPPLGDIELDEAMKLAGDRFIITGGLSAAECQRLKSRDEVFKYVRELILRMKPYAHRFILSASCNTPYSAPWNRIVDFRDAWIEEGW